MHSTTAIRYIRYNIVYTAPHAIAHMLENYLLNDSLIYYPVRNRKFLHLYVKVFMYGKPF